MRSLLKKFRSGYMVNTFLNLRGNQRACVWLEPLWGIPYNLYIPYFTLYMTQLGLSVADIGTITTINLISQMVAAILSGVLTDKLGRRWCSLIFDTLSWSVPAAIWACSQNMMWFVAAAMFNGLWRVTENSCVLLMVEDAPKEIVTPMFSLKHLMGLCVAFVAPLSKIAVDAFGVVPTLRVLYSFAAVSMTVKFLILFFWSKETTVGRRRLAATKSESMFKLLWECKDVYISIIRQKRMVLTLAIIAIFTLITTLTSDYWALYLVNNLGIADGNVPLLTTFKSIVLVLCIFWVVPKASKAPMKRPMLLSFGAFALSQAILMLIPRGIMAWPLLLVSVALEGIALSVLNPLTSSLLFFNADPEERARVNGMVYATITLIVAVFPIIIGRFTMLSLRVPFLVNLALFALAAALTVAISKLPQAKEEEKSA